MRATGPLLPNIPTAITARTAGLAPALLAALVAIELTGPNGVVHVDVKIPAVIVAGGLAALRVPFIVCVVAGARRPQRDFARRTPRYSWVLSERPAVPAER